MKTLKQFSSFVVGSSLVCIGSAGQVHAAPAQLTAVRMDKLPVGFIENCGQWEETVKFAASKGHLCAFFENGAINLRVASGQKDALRLVFEGAAAQTTLTGEEKHRAHYNFFFGNDPARWQTNVSTYSSVLYRGLYSGVDMRVREERGRLEYDLLLAP